MVCSVPHLGLVLVESVGKVRQVTQTHRLGQLQVWGQRFAHDCLSENLCEEKLSLMFIKVKRTYLYIIIKVPSQQEPGWGV